MDTRTNNTIRVYWRRDLSSLELTCLENSATLWRHYCTGFELLISRTWRAEIFYRRRVYVVAPGSVLCAGPGFVWRVVRVLHPGALSVLTIEGEGQLKQMLHAPARCALVVPNSRSEMQRAGQRLIVDLQNGNTPAQDLRSSLQTFLSVIVEAAVSTIARTSSDVGADHLEVDRVPSRTAAFVRDSDYLSQIAFRSVRQFKDQVGLPPHAYDLCRRVAFAKQSLRAGSTPSTIAIDYGFVDQSHLIRHFKRLVGMTPTQYSRSDMLLECQRRSRPPRGSQALCRLEVERDASAFLALPSLPLDGALHPEGLK
jgi:hypothetical protein